MNIFEYTFDQLALELKRRYGKGRFHAAALMRGVYQRPATPLAALPEFKPSPALAAQIERDLVMEPGRVVVVTHEDDLSKYVTRLNDGYEIESVVVPMATHQTLCISCQVGCAMGCKFCETGRMGWHRNLTAAEIVAQVYTAKVLRGHNIRNVVFMGMGEPLDNFEAVTQAVRVISDQRGLDIAKRHITISTAGRIDGIRRLAALDWPRLNLALSVNAPNDTLRTRLMPINRRYNLQALRLALLSYPLRRKGLFFIEYILIKGINDQAEHAAELAAWLKPLKYRLNLIPYNPAGDRRVLEVPDASDLDRFIHRLVAAGVFVRRRTAKGRTLSAACGQLGNRHLATRPTPFDNASGH